MKLSKGYIQIYTGRGKGKTTAALGLALRAAGSGLRVYVGQFAKGRTSGEQRALKRFGASIIIEQYGLPCFIKAKAGGRHRAMAAAGLQKARAAIEGGRFDLVILDELSIALHYDLIPLREIRRLLRKKPARVEVIMTGRYMPRSIRAMADLITDMRETRHYFTRGVRARRGIEF